MSEKDKLRRRVRHARRELTLDFQQAAAQQAANQLLQLPQWPQIQRVGVYLANDGELDPAPLVNLLWQHNKQSYLPRLHPFRRGYLLFQHYTADSELVANRFGIAEPQLDVRTVLPVRELDLILLPLVAFDQMGNRLGMGGGFYDRTLASISAQPISLMQTMQTMQKRQPLLVGFAHDLQQVEQLPVEPWDHPLSAVITPSDIYCFS